MISVMISVFPVWALREGKITYRELSSLAFRRIIFYVKIKIYLDLNDYLIESFISFL